MIEAKLNPGAATDASRDATWKALEMVLVKDDCVLSYDRSLVEQLPEILRENYGIKSNEDLGGDPKVASLCEQLWPGQRQKWCIAELPSRLAKYTDQCRFIIEPSRSDVLASEFEHWSSESVEQNRGSVLSLQKDLGMGQYNAAVNRHDPHLLPIEQLGNYLRSVTSVPPTWLERWTGRSYWEIRIKLWELLGRIYGSRRSLSIGPRWVTEILYFRQVLGFKHHIGLDLFSDAPGLVIPGDMHRMPFRDATFNLIFLKNVVDKSYDVRRLVNELIRVVERNGVVIIDQVCGYGMVSPLTRTDIQKARNLLRLFRARTNLRVLVCEDAGLVRSGDRATNNARLALQILN